MPANDRPHAPGARPVRCAIRVAGHLDDRWASAFDGFALRREEDGVTLLTGPVADQAALHALLRRVRDLGLPLRLLSGAPYLGAFDSAQLHALALAFRDLHHAGYLIAQVFFGLWLLPLGVLVYRSGFLPRAVGVLLVIACAGYLADVALFFLAPGFGLVLSEFTFVGELALMLWLLVFGVNVRRWERRAVQPA